MAEKEEEINLHDDENAASVRSSVMPDESEANQKENEENEEESVRSSMMPDEAYLLELNLVMIIASLALSNQELSELEDVEKLHAKEHDFKTIVSKLRAKKRGFDEVKIPDRRATRLQPKILDSRHGRKM